MFFSIPSIVDIKKFNEICRNTNLVKNLFSNTKTGDCSFEKKQ